MLVPNGVRMRKHRMGEVGITLERAPPGPEMLKKHTHLCLGGLRIHPPWTSRGRS